VKAAVVRVDERQALVRAGHAVLRRTGGAAMTVADVLVEAGLSTRAFYRHFSSKDELVLAVFATESERSVTRFERAVDAAPDEVGAVAAWIDEVLALGFESRRARRTQTFWREGATLRGQFPAAFAAIVDAMLAPLERALARGRASGVFPDTDPARDARSIHAVVWALVEARLDDADTAPRTLADARAHALRFCLPPLGARP
jgi:AcrR family transcriptional regulator